MLAIRYGEALKWAPESEGVPGDDHVRFAISVYVAAVAQPHRCARGVGRRDRTG